MFNIRQRFTKWYYRKGYRMNYRPGNYTTKTVELIFSCPWWIRPFVSAFFSPCEYYREELYNKGMEEN
jgi:hypothetical protein